MLQAKPIINIGSEKMTAQIAVAIPCYNEEAAITKVVRDFRRVLPDAQIYVFDNNSTDRSQELARAAGAEIIKVLRRGKGNVMRAIFDYIVADALIVVDGDGTYCAEEAPILMEPVLNGRADMVVGDRLKKAEGKAFTRLNKFGNHLIVEMINVMFGTSYEDILSGYRVFSRRFVENVPLLTPGFETETELTLQALQEGFEVREIPISYAPRDGNGKSKLRPFADGWRIMITMGVLLRDHYPLRIYGLMGMTFFLFALISCVLRLLYFYGIPLLPREVLNGMIIFFTPLGITVLGIGLILSAVNCRLREMKQIMLRKRG